MEDKALWHLEYEGIEAYTAFESSLLEALDLSEKGAEKFISIITNHLKLELEESKGKVNDQLKKLMKAFATTVEASVEVANVISSKGPGYIKESIPIGVFLSTGNFIYVAVAREVTRVLIENCENLSDWRDFISCEPDKVKLMEKFLINMETFVKRDSDEKKQRAAFSNLVSTLDSDSDSNKVFRSPSAGLDVIKKVESEEKDSALASKGDEENIEKRIEESIQNKKKIMGRNFSQDEVLDNVINTVMSTLSLHSIERQTEILDTAQSVILGTILQIKKRMKKLAQNYNEDAFKELRNQLAEAQKKLVTIQKEKHLKKERRMKERHELLQKETGTGISQQHIDLQQRSVNYLTTLYDTFSKGVIYTDISPELCIIDHLLSTVFEVSVSLFVSGLISVGKSTIVNCLTGQNLCPNRSETMTAIPTRYIHSSNAVDPNDPKKVIPRMFIPFYRELNATISKIQDFLREKDFNQIKSQLRKVHLGKLLERIYQGDLKFRDKYLGEESILEASTNIHDLFRIGCSEIFPTSILAGLPLSWRSGPDHYLTVITKFPSIDVATDLVEFSIIDTPGIDEDGVKELNLENTLKEVCEACNFAALITTPTGVNSTAMIPLKQIFKGAKITYKVPSLAIATSADTVSKEADREETKQNILLCLKDPQNEQQLFNQNEIFFVSAKKYFLGTTLLSYYESNGFFPKLEDKDPVLDDFLFFAFPGRDEEERIEEYKRADYSDITEKCNKLIKTSYMGPLLSRMIETSVFNGIPVCVHNAIEKAQKHVKRGLKKMRLASRDENISRTTNLIHNAEASIKNTLTATKEAFGQDRIRIKGIAAKVLSDISSAMEAMRSSPLPEDAPLGDFVGYYAMYIRDLKPEQYQAQNLVRTKEKQVFQNEEDFRKAIQVLVAALKGAILGYTTMRLWNDKRRIFEVGNQKRDQIIRELEEVRLNCASTLNLEESHFEIKIDEVKISDSKTMDISPFIDSYMRKKNQGGIISKITNFFSKGTVAEYSPVQEYLEDCALSYSQYFVGAFVSQLEKNIIDINASLAGANDTLAEYQDALVQVKFNPTLNDDGVTQYVNDMRKIYKSEEPEALLAETAKIIASIQNSSN